MSWRARARRIIGKVFDCQVTLVAGVVRASLMLSVMLPRAGQPVFGGALGHGETESIARAKAVDEALRLLETEACRPGMTGDQRLDAVRRLAIRWRQGLVQ